MPGEKTGSYTGKTFILYIFIALAVLFATAVLTGCSEMKEAIKDLGPETGEESSNKEKETEQRKQDDLETSRDFYQDNDSENNKTNKDAEETTVKKEPQEEDKTDKTVRGEEEKESSSEDKQEEKEEKPEEDIPWPPSPGFDGNEEVRRKALSLVENSPGQEKALEEIYDWVTHNISYDMEKYRRLSVSIEGYQPDAGEILASKEGVCGHYAELTRQMLLAVGIEATYEDGEVLNKDGSREKHAWNHAEVNGKTLALDTTWGAGHRSETGEFVRMPTRLYLTTPQELEKMQQDPEYHTRRRKELLVEKAENSPPEFLPSYEEQITSELEVASSEILQEIARSEAKKIGGKTLQYWERVFVQEEGIDNSWMDGDHILSKLSDSDSGIMGIEASVFTSWGYPPETDEIIRNIRHQVSMQNYNEVGTGIVQREDLIIVFVLFGQKQDY